MNADHIGLKTVDGFINASDFCTLDVADFTGKAAETAAMDDLVPSLGKYVGLLSIPVIERPFAINEKQPAHRRLQVPPGGVVCGQHLPSRRSELGKVCLVASGFPMTTPLLLCAEHRSRRS